MTNITNIKPLGDRVLLVPIEDDNEGLTKGGIIIPDTVNKERPERGRVVAVGPGKHNSEGKLIPLSVKKGQTVLFSKYGPDEVKIDDEIYYILGEDNILAVLEK